MGGIGLTGGDCSHHPPVTAYAILNEKNGVKLEGYNGQKASFARGTISVKQIGHSKYHLKEFNEDCECPLVSLVLGADVTPADLISLPSLHIEGIVYGSPYVELNRSTTITSSTGYISKIDYSGKGWVSGKKNSFTATMSKEGSKDALYIIEGQWTDTFTIKKGPKGKEEVRSHVILYPRLTFADPAPPLQIETYSAKTNKTTPLTLLPLDQQDPLESRRAWAKVQAAVLKGDLDSVGIEKSRIENEQRELRKQEKEAGREWERRYFKRADEDPIFTRLAISTGQQVEKDKTDGVWIFDEDRYR